MIPLSLLPSGKMKGELIIVCDTEIFILIGTYESAKVHYVYSTFMQWLIFAFSSFIFFFLLKNSFDDD